MHFFRLRLVLTLLLGITLISLASTYFDVLAHKHTLRADLARRTQWYAAGLQPQVEQHLATDAKLDWPGILQSLRRQSDQPTLAAFDTSGNLLAFAGNDTLPLQSLPKNLLQRTINSDKDSSVIARTANPAAAPGSGPGFPANIFSLLVPSTHMWFEESVPLHNGPHTVALLVLVVDANYIRAEGFDVWNRSFLRILAMVLLVVVVTLVMVRWFMQQPIARAADWMRRLRHGQANVEEGANEFGYLVPLAREVTSLAETLARARLSAETEARLRDSAERFWTAERLAVHLRERLDNGRLLVVSNREPYMHTKIARETQCIVPPSGLVTAIEPVLRACDGTWIAHGSGSEDAAFVDAHDRLRVPPEERLYTLRRVWLSPEEEAGHYEGFSNEGLWPLCHIAHTRPIFRAGDWSYYQKVNAKFAEVLLDEMRGMHNPVVFVQDYHFALLPQIIKNARPDARIAIFWHIPWPNPETFGICPWQAELVQGLLGADVIGFHLQSHCNNFLATVDRTLEARTDWEHFSILRNGHHSAVRPYPISVAWDDHQPPAESTDGFENPPASRNSPISITTPLSGNGFRSPAAVGANGYHERSLHRELDIEGKRLILGVDRMDYTKGIVERLLAIEQLLQDHPDYIEQIVFVQIASPSRTTIPRYAELRLRDAAVETDHPHSAQLQPCRSQSLLSRRRHLPRHFAS